MLSEKHTGKITDIPDGAEVVICGAGMIGVAIAYHLAVEMGAQDVLLIDKRTPLSFTSDKSAELFSCNDWNQAKRRFKARSVALMEELAESTGNLFNMTRRGVLSVATRSETVASFWDRLNSDTLRLSPVRVFEPNSTPSTQYVPSTGEGLAKEPLGADLLLDEGLIRAHYPFLSDDVLAILHTRDSGWFSAHTLGTYLLEQAKGRGVRVIQGEVVAVDKDKHGVCAVRVVKGSGVKSISTRRFVVAAGPFVKRVAAMVNPEVEIPAMIRVIEKILIKDYLGIVPRSAPIISHESELFLEWSEQERDQWQDDDEYRWLLDEFSCGTYLRPEGGKDSPWLLIGWEYAPEAGRPVEVREPTWEPRLSDSVEYVDLTVRAASTLIPGLKRYIGRMVKPAHDGGYFVRMRDPLSGEFVPMPLIGPLGVEGAFIACVYPGVSSGCAAGELAAAWVAGGNLPDYADELSLKRYQ